MSNAKRPSAARKHTRTTKAKADDALDQGYRIIIDGVAHEARLGDVTPEIARELRRHIGTGFMGLLDQMAGAPDIDLVSAAVWVSRRIRGEAVAFDAVAVTYADMLAEGFDIVSPAAEEADPSDPEG